VTPAEAEPYHLTAGSSVLGYLENDKQNVNLGFNSVFNELLSSENVKCDFKNFDSSDGLAVAIKNGQANAFFGSPVEFLKSESYLLSSPIASGVFNNQLKSRILLVVRKDSGIDTFQQLKGKVLATQKWISADMGGMYLETLLLENKLPISQRFFSEIQNTDTSNRALVDLFFKKVDVTLISENQYDIATELNPQLREQTKIIIASEPYLIFVAALSKNTPEQEINGIKKSLLTIHRSARGKSILSLMKIQSF
jgi:ABC-type phosphate/phosphonate transport system substrate-binding protein